MSRSWGTSLGAAAPRLPKLSRTSGTKQCNGFRKKELFKRDWNSRRLYIGCSCARHGLLRFEWVRACRTASYVFVKLFTNRWSCLQWSACSMMCVALRHYPTPDLSGTPRTDQWITRVMAVNVYVCIKIHPILLTKNVFQIKSSCFLSNSLLSNAPTECEFKQKVGKPTAHETDYHLMTASGPKEAPGTHF